MKQKQSRIHLIKHFDYVGTFLFIAGFVLFLTGLKWGGSTYAWNSAAVISTIVIGAVCLIILAFWEIYAPLKEPLIPMYLFGNRGWVASNLLLAIGASVYYATGLVWPQLVSAVYSASHSGDPMWAGYTSSLVGIFIAVGEMFGGLLAQKIGKVKYQCIFFVAVGSACLIAMASCTVESQGRAIALVIVSLFCIGWNELICFSLTTILIQDQRDIGAAAGVAGSTRSIISTIASTVYQVVLRARLKKTVPAIVAPVVLKAGLPPSSLEAYFAALTVGTAKAFSNVPGITPAIQAAGSYADRVANMSAFKTVFFVSIAFGGIAIFLSFLIPNVESLMTGEVSATLHQRHDENMLAGTKYEGNGFSHVE